MRPHTHACTHFLPTPSPPQGQDGRILGAGGKHIPQLINVMVQVLGRGSDLVEGDTGPRMVKLLQALQQDPRYAPLVEQAFGALPDKHKANFTAHLEGRAA